MLYGLLVLVYVLVCLFLIATVLLQTGKRADLAGAFGGGGSQTAFGVRGAANALTRATTGAAIGFMVLALTLSILARGRDSGSVLDDVQPTTPPPAEGSQSAPISGDGGDALPVDTDDAATEPAEETSGSDGAGDDPATP